MLLVEHSLNDFLEKLASDSPAPGGGSVAAMTGALAGALCTMVARLTLGREKYREVWEDMERVRSKADDLSGRLLELVDRDTEAYNRVMAAFKLPKGDDDQKAARSDAIQSATKQAAQVPMETLQTIAGLVGLVKEVLEKGNPNCLTDAGVAAQLIRAAALGTAYNIRINLSGIHDKDFADKLKNEVAELIAHIDVSMKQLNQMVEQGLG